MSEENGTTAPSLLYMCGDCKTPLVVQYHYREDQDDEVPHLYCPGCDRIVGWTVPS